MQDFYIDLEQSIENRKRNLSGDEFCASKLFESQERYSFSVNNYLEI